MKKRLTFGLVTLALTAAAAGLRYWQRAAAFEGDTGLLTPGHPATGCLVALLVIGAAALLGLARWCVKGGGPKSYLRAFALPHPGMLALYLLSGAVLVGAGSVGLLQARAGVEHRMGYLALGLCLLLGGLCVALVGWLNTQKREAEGRFAWPLLGPAVSGCVWLVVSYQERSVDPTVMEYAPGLLGVLCAVWACYTMAAFSFEKPMGAWCLWLSAMGVILLAVGVTDSLLRNTIPLTSLGYMLYLAAQLICLLTRCEVPACLEPWTPPADQEDYDIQLEESDYE